MSSGVERYVQSQRRLKPSETSSSRPRRRECGHSLGWKFIPDYATVAAPLTDLTRKTKPNQVEWTPECAAAFDQLKDSLCLSPVP